MCAAQVIATKAKKAVSNKEVLQKADLACQYMRDWQALFSLKSACPATLTAQGHLEMELVQIALDKKKRPKETFFEALAASAEDLAKALGVTVQVPPLWLTAPAAPAAAHKSTLASVPRIYDRAGVCTNQVDVLRGMGFLVGEHVIRRDELKAKILGLSESEVTLELLDSKEKKYSSVEGFFNDEWKVWKPPKEQVEIQWLTMAPSTSIEMQCAMLKAKVVLAMWQQLQTKQGCFKDIAVFKQPKQIIVKKAYAEHKLQIPCCSPKVTLNAEEENAGDFVIGMFQSMFVSISSYTKMPQEDKDGNIKVGAAYLNPFHMLPKVEEDGNMEVRAQRRQCMLDHGFAQLACLIVIVKIAKKKQQSNARRRHPYRRLTRNIVSS